MASTLPRDPVHSNHYVDYVIRYNFGGETGKMAVCPRPSKSRCRSDLTTTIST